MSLKRKITKAEYDALNALLQAEYKADGADFVLDAQGFDDPGELKRALDREKQEKKEAKEKAEALELKLATITDVDARRAGDVVTLEKSWKVKMDAAQAESDAKLKAKDGILQGLLVNNVAQEMASELGGENAAILLPHIITRLTADLTGEKPLTRVLDKDGKPSAFSVEDLKKEISGNKLFAPVIVASRASGGGAAGGNRTGNGGAGTGQKKFSELNDLERTQMYKDNPTEFAKQSEAAQHERLVAVNPRGF